MKILKKKESESLLEKALAAYKKDDCRENLLALLAVLSVSKVWVPCRWRRPGEQGIRIGTSGEIPITPALMKDGEEYIFPVYTRKSAAAKLDWCNTEIEKSMIETIRLARSKQEYPVKIVINPGKESFELKRAGWASMEQAAQFIFDVTL